MLDGFSTVSLNQISFASASSLLNDRNRFKKFFRTFPSLDNYAPAILKLLQTLKWKRLAIFTQKEALFENVI